MRRGRVQVLKPVDEDASDGELDWWPGKGKKKAAAAATVPKTAPFATPAPGDLPSYPGDPTEQEVIDNIHNLPAGRSGGKVSDI